MSPRYLTLTEVVTLEVILTHPVIQWVFKVTWAKVGILCETVPQPAIVWVIKVTWVRVWMGVELPRKGS